MLISFILIVIGVLMMYFTNGARFKFSGHIFFGGMALIAFGLLFGTFSFFHMMIQDHQNDIFINYHNDTKGVHYGN